MLFKNLLRITISLVIAAGGHAQETPTSINNPIPQIELSPTSASPELEQCLSPVTSFSDDKLKHCEAALAGTREPATRARIFTAMSQWSVNKGDLVTASRHIEDALAIAPDDPSVLNNWGAILIRQDSFAAATDAFSRGLLGAQQSTQSPELTGVLYHNRSIALRALGEYAEAAADYAEYLRIMRLN
ncbi:MAG: tetratricopeptide repeat protein [bacterium]